MSEAARGEGEEGIPLGAPRPPARGRPPPQPEPSLVGAGDAEGAGCGGRWGGGAPGAAGAGPARTPRRKQKTAGPEHPYALAPGPAEGAKARAAGSGGLRSPDFLRASLAPGRPEPTAAPAALPRVSPARPRSCCPPARGALRSGAVARSGGTRRDDRSGAGLRAAGVRSAPLARSLSLLFLFFPLSLE